jgi:hypothetical protein
MRSKNLTLRLPMSYSANQRGHCLLCLCFADAILAKDKGLKPGIYILQADRNGFPPQRYGQRKPRGPDIKLNLEPGQAVTGIVFPLMPPGAISGRITDETGEPLLNFDVTIEEPVYTPNGWRSILVKTTKTDDRGEYRAFLLPPGKYHMKATPDLMFKRGVVNSSYVATYYPGVPDSSSASDINVDPGADVGGIDLVLHKQRLFTIRGRIVDSKIGMPPASPNFELERRDSGDRVPLRPDYNPTNGTFSLMNVPSGSYWIRARLYLYRVEDQTRLSNTTRLAHAAIDISADITDVLLQIPSDVSIGGSVSLDNGGAAIADLPDFRGAVVGLNAKDNIGISLQAPIRPDGTFLIENVQPADYTLFVRAPQANYYIKAGRFEGNDIMNGVRVASAPSEPLTIVLGSDTAKVTGTIMDGDHKPVSGINAILIPTYERERLDLYRTGTTDQLGRFTLLPVVPGEYKLFAWEDDKGFAYGDSDFLRRYEEVATPVTVRPSGTLDIEVKVIPASR